MRECSEDRGFIRVPVHRQGGQKSRGFAPGSLMTDAYSAQATVFISDVDISGTVYFDNAEFVQAYKEYDQKMMNGEEVQMPRVITGYELVADDQVVEPIDGGWGVDNKTGQYHVELRYDLPEAPSSCRSARFTATARRARGRGNLAELT